MISPIPPFLSGLAIGAWLTSAWYTIHLARLKSELRKRLKGDL